MSHQYYFFVDPQNVTQQQAVLRDDEHHHLSRVLRHRPGDAVSLVDGRGMLYTGTIAEIGKRETHIRIESQTHNFGEERFRLTLAQAVPQPSRFEWLLEKGTEIGVAAFWPLHSQFSGAKSQKGNAVRWQRIIKAALKQCGRSVMPAIEPPRRFEHVIDSADQFDFRWIAHAPAPEGTKKWSFQQAGDKRSGKGLLLIGPEAGFSEPEIALACQKEFHFIDLGVRRLRSETAGLIAAGLVLRQFAADSE